MTRTTLVIPLALLGLVAAGSVAAKAEGTTGVPLVREGISLELGHRDFLNYCAACHGVGGKGDGTMAEFLTLAVPNLTKLSKLNGGKFPAEKVAAVIDGRTEVKVHGARDMPVWGDWFNREAAASGADKATRELIVSDRIASLITYLKSIQVK